MGIRISPNRGLQAASLIAQGAEKFMTAYQGQRARQTAAEIQQMQLRSEMELRKMQMEKLRQEVAPVEFDMRKLNVILQGVEQGFVPESVYKKSAENLVENIDSPAKLAAAQNALNMAAARDANQMSPMAFAPGMAPAPRQNPNILRMSPQEAEFVGKVVTARGQQAAIGQRREAALMGFEADMARIAGDMARARTKEEFDKAQAELDRAMKIRQSEISAGATVTAAKIRAGAAGKKTAESPEVKALNQRILNYEKQIAKELGSPSGFSMDVPGQREERAKTLQAERDRLIQERDQLLRGAPAAKQAPKTPVKPAASQVTSFKRSDAGVVQKMKALPEGSSFILDGVKYKIQNGAPVKE